MSPLGDNYNSYTKYNIYIILTFILYENKVLNVEQLNYFIFIIFIFLNNNGPISLISDIVVQLLQTPQYL